jgi:hypothetical protein
MKYRSIVVNLLAWALTAVCLSCDGSQWQNSLVFGTEFEEPDPTDPSTFVLIGQGNTFPAGSIAMRFECAEEFGDRLVRFRFLVGTTPQFEMDFPYMPGIPYPAGVHGLFEHLNINDPGVYDVRAYLVDLRTAAETFVIRAPLEITAP